MKLAALAAGLPVAQIVGDSQTEITSLAYDSRRVAAGSLFFCIPGLKADGHEYAAQAALAGAAALVCEHPLEVPLPQIVVPAARRALALLADAYYGHPTGHLRVYAVTGTNGKTTTAHLLAAILESAGLRPALLGTVVNRIAGVETPVKLTTAESLELQEMFRRMVDAGDLSCVMEASSHALVLERTAGIEFEAVMFTNLTRDHLDFHRDVDDYYAAKRRLLLPDDARQPGAVAVVNLGDEHGRRLARECGPVYGDDLWTFVLDGDPEPEKTPAVSVGDLEMAADHCAFELRCERLDLRRRFSLAIPARFNIANATAAAVAALATGVSADAVGRGLATAGGVPGRVEPVRCGQPFTVLVDYAHTPDSLENVLRAVRGVSTGRLICVFGCGGDRDRGKRPLMGAAAAGLSDVAVITSDNPRSEDPLAIIAEIREGVSRSASAEVVIEADRRAAIASAIGRAREGDVVVIAGKGHESYQIIGGETLAFDDRAAAREALANLGWSAEAVPRPGSPPPC